MNPYRFNKKIGLIQKQVCRIFFNKRYDKNNLKILGNPNFKPNWNSLDGQINRESYNGIYQIDKEGYPLNIFGRTGIRGRGLLGRYGPNFAADPIVTKFKLDKSGKPVNYAHSGKNILQMCAIERHDCHEWALPGGMVDPGEMVSQTLKREFMEEAMASASSTEELEKFFENGQEIYRGYVDDPRNTDNAWMETVAVNFHDETGNIVGKFKLEAGDDARKVKWFDIDSGINLYASHFDIVKKVVESLNAHW